MVRLLRRVLLRILIKETLILDKSTYPNYDLLERTGSVDIATSKGVFKFTIKKDVVKICDKLWVFSLKCQRYTVELLPMNPDDHSFYKDKIMLTVKIGGFHVMDVTLMNCLIDMYLDKMYKMKILE